MSTGTMRRFPSSIGCLKLAPWAVAQVLRSPLALIVLAALLWILSAAAVLPGHARLSDLLDHNPLAAGYEGRFLLDDLDRLHPETMVSLGALPLAATLLITFFAGGILACIGITSGRRLRVSDFLAESGRYFFRSLRTWCLFLLALILWSWAVFGGLLPFLSDLFLAGGSDTRQLVFDLGTSVVWLLGFGLLLALRRLALARLVLLERRSAVVAFFGSIGLVLRRPFSLLTAFAGLFLIWGVGMAVVGLSVNRFIDDGNRLLLALLAGMAGGLVQQGCNMASFVMARRICALDLSDREQISEPTVVVPAGVRKAETRPEVAVSRP